VLRTTLTSHFFYVHITVHDATATLCTLIARKDFRFVWLIQTLILVCVYVMLFVFMMLMCGFILALTDGYLLFFLLFLLKLNSFVLD